MELTTIARAYVQILCANPEDLDSVLRPSHLFSCKITQKRFSDYSFQIFFFLIII